MKFTRRSVDAFAPIELAVNHAVMPKVAPLAPWHKNYPAADGGAAMLAFAVGLLVAAIGAVAEEPARPQSTAERDGTDSVRVQPTAKQFAAPNQPDLSASDARTVDALYRLLVGPPSATSSDFRSSTPPFGNARR